MDSDSLFFSLELVAGSGNSLSLEQKAALQTSLVILKKNYKFQRVLFWGKILGLRQDYFIAQGRGQDELRDRKYLYRSDSYSLPTGSCMFTCLFTCCLPVCFVSFPALTA
uniref:Radial spoke head protein 9 homolog n=1 Tax=Acanthochromis polyacanthus TaxID=80966 RepID=A0A3Q1HC66_9TELE